MTIEQDLVTALGATFSGRFYPNTFTQEPGAPTWPAGRYVVVAAVPSVDICGDGGDETADITIQIDIGAKTYAEVKTLRSTVMAAMVSFDPPAIWDGERNDYDPETKVHVCSIDYLFYPSSEEESPP